MNNAPTNGCFDGAYAGRRVLVTGHTGFKGAWLSEWLLKLGADVTGFALPPPTSPSLFDQLGLASRVRHVVGDVRDPAAVRGVVEACRPDFVFHLAAQPLVRRSYAEPLETYATNVMGTAHVLEALRLAGRPVSVVVVTTDKCYENREWVHSYREEDALGGHDPYSSSKAAAELVVSSYRRSFFSVAPLGGAIRVASARAGNVIGGGDWAEDRIVPDCIRSLSRHERILVRNQGATRPWQHVLDPLSGYLWLGAKLHAGNPDGGDPGLASAFNFGPGQESNRNVAELVQEVLKHWPGEWENGSNPKAPHEAQRLNLATDKAHHLLQWRPTWDFAAAVAETVTWYRDAQRTPEKLADLTRAQLDRFTLSAAQAVTRWAIVPAATSVANPKTHARTAA